MIGKILCLYFVNKNLLSYSRKLTKQRQRILYVFSGISWCLRKIVAISIIPLYRGAPRIDHESFEPRLTASSTLIASLPHDSSCNLVFSSALWGSRKFFWGKKKCFTIGPHAVVFSWQQRHVLIFQNHAGPLQLSAKAAERFQNLLEWVSPTSSKATCSNFQVLQGLNIPRSFT
jgi:hypothetical protein